MRDPDHTPLSRSRVLALPLAFTLVLAAFAWLPSVRQSPRLFWSVLAAAGVLLVALALLGRQARHRALTLGIVLRSQHYLQACAQSTVLLYWGWYWRPVYDAVPLLAVQLLFAYAFDMLLGWWRRDDYTLGFAPFPVIFSINLFLWFKADWFYLQFAMIALGFAAKELLRWEKSGRRTHIFNPSSFPLAVFSLGLIVTGTTSWTWGPEIARTQFNPPYIYVLLFLVGLPGQFLFGVTTMTMSAVLTTYAFGLAYVAATGSYFFVDSYIPVAVFLGMHLLFTDPSTSPRTELGRIIFGMLYGIGNIVLYELLRQVGLPAFYDKLLPVPILNLAIQLIDRAAKGSWLQRLDPARLLPAAPQRRRNLAYMAVWSAVFATMTSVGAVGDHHPGHRVPFWQQACQADARNACANLEVILATYCQDGSGWACNDLGALRWSRRVEQADASHADFMRACTLGFAAGCENAATLERGAGPPRTAAPMLQDYPVILRTGKGALPDKTPVELFTRACDQGWMSGCYSLAATFMRGGETPRDPARAAAAFETACTGGHAGACADLGLMHYRGDGVTRDQEKGVQFLKTACDLKLPNACRWLEDVRAGRSSPAVR